MSCISVRRLGSEKLIFLRGGGGKKRRGTRNRQNEPSLKEKAEDGKGAPGIFEGDAAASQCRVPGGSKCFKKMVEEHLGEWLKI